MEDAKNKNGGKGLIIFLIIIILVLLGTVGYLLYDKLSKNDLNTLKSKNEIEETENVVNTRELNNDEISILKDLVNDINDLSEQFPTTLDDISKQKIFNFLYNKSITNDFTNVTVDTINNNKNKYFGSNYILEMQDYICEKDGIAIMKYDQNSNKFILNESHPGHGGIGKYQSIPYYVSGTVTDENQYEVTFKNVFTNYCSDTCAITAYFGNYSNAKNNQDPLFEKSSAQMESGYTFNDADYEKYKDSIQERTYTFKKDANGNYNFISVK